MVDYDEVLFQYENISQSMNLYTYFITLPIIFITYYIITYYILHITHIIIYRTFNHFINMY